MNEKLKNKLVNTERNGCIAVDTYVSPNSKVFYVLKVGYMDNKGKWINHKLTLLDPDLTTVMCLLRKSSLYPVKSYNKINNE